MKKIHPIIALGLLLSACATNHPQTVMVNGQEGIKIRPVAMLGTDEPTTENVARQAQRIRTGDHGGGLQKVAVRHCPNGFKILQEGEPQANIYVLTPIVQYRVSQDFIISCTNG